MRHRHHRSNPRALEKYLVLRIGRDNSDTYAKELGGLSTNDAIDDVLDSALPDRGSIVEWTIVEASDAGAARLHGGHTGPRARWQRVTDKQITYWRSRQYAPDIRGGMARALWVSAWAGWVGEQPRKVQKELGPGSGGDWANAAPETPESADDAAMEIYEEFERVNGVPMGALLEQAVEADDLDEADDEYADSFGHYLAMQTMGEGVSWFDDHNEFPLKFPRRVEALSADGETLDWSPHFGATYSKNPDLTPESLALFLMLARDAGNWSGNPLIDISPAQRGNLTALKRKKLLTTYHQDGDQWAQFTEAGVELAAQHGIRLTADLK